MVTLPLRITLSVAGVLLITLFSLATGGSESFYGEVTGYYSGDERYVLIFEQIRLPRTLSAFFAGAALGLSGTLLQAVLKNPLASPFTLGISSAGAFGASFAIIVLQSYAGIRGSSMIALCAFAAALLSTLFILYLGNKTRMQNSALILAGVAIGALFNAMTMFLQYFASELDAAATLFWTFGDLSKAGMHTAAVFAVLSVGVLALFWRFFWQFDAMELGKSHARSLGVHTTRLQLGALIAASLLAAVTVAFLGVIGFIGLIAPHIVRLLFGNTHKLLLPLSALFGAGLLTGADIGSRVLLAPVTLPVGILTAFLGAPLFLYLLVWRHR